MRIIQTSDVGVAGERRTIYHLEVAEGFFADVMRVEKSGLMYVMQNEDGSTVFDADGNSCPEFSIDESKTIRFVASATRT